MGSVIERQSLPDLTLPPSMVGATKRAIPWRVKLFSPRADNFYEGGLKSLEPNSQVNNT
jgi:hypothetical protein